ncbi:hypothetical protein BAZ12_19510 [Elizabethkingia miricola]|uniref:hypothetical protein n=1 Tax=Elizabethkingia miricola TaxID=172045 RepID=UPI00099958EA|nr:hypothetical protein [Elizabethkingia miricola]OPC76199.1 hypothetical protein BAZ12_19510 [Elizabethkingia miricola]
MKATSVLAHDSIKPHKEYMHEKILKGFKKIKRGSFRDIAAASGLREDQVWKRLSEMEKKNMIRDTGDVKLCEISHRPVVIWELV